MVGNYCILKRPKINYKEVERSRRRKRGEGEGREKGKEGESLALIRKRKGVAFDSFQFNFNVREFAKKKKISKINRETRFLSVESDKINTKKKEGG